METMHAAGRRSLPPVPRRARDDLVARPVADALTDRLDPVDVAVVESSAPEPNASQPNAAGSDAPGSDAEQHFVSRLRSAAADFASAAGAESAVVREAVPPARHRRSRCRLVLRYADHTEADVTLLGAAGEPGAPSRHGFDRQIRRWLGDGQRRDDAWLVADPDASDGVAVDVSAWLASG